MGVLSYIGQSQVTGDVKASGVAELSPGVAAVAFTPDVGGDPYRLVVFDAETATVIRDWDVPGVPYDESWSRVMRMHVHPLPNGRVLLFTIDGVSVVDPMTGAGLGVWQWLGGETVEDQTTVRDVDGKALATCGLPAAVTAGDVVRLVAIGVGLIGATISLTGEIIYGWGAKLPYAETYRWPVFSQTVFTSNAVWDGSSMWRVVMYSDATTPLTLATLSDSDGSSVTTTGFDVEPWGMSQAVVRPGGFEVLSRSLDDGEWWLLNATAGGVAVTPVDVAGVGEPYLASASPAGIQDDVFATTVIDGSLHLVGARSAPSQYPESPAGPFGNAVIGSLSGGYVIAADISRIAVHRYLPSAGIWPLRQRQALNATGSWPLRQRQNGAHSGSWPLRQRQSGV